MLKYIIKKYLVAIKMDKLLFGTFKHFNSSLLLIFIKKQFHQFPSINRNKK